MLNIISYYDIGADSLLPRAFVFPFSRAVCTTAITARVLFPYAAGCNSMCVLNHFSLLPSERDWHFCGVCSFSCRMRDVDL